MLGVASGAARVRFGGDGGPELELAAGDVVVIPAGVAHMLLEERERLLVVGAYAGGRHWDIVRANPKTLPAAQERIAQVPLPEADPVAGGSGTLLTLWAE